jgi:hypothetical protein
MLDAANCLSAGGLDWADDEDDEAIDHAFEDRSGLAGPPVNGRRTAD